MRPDDDVDSSGGQAVEHRAALIFAESARKNAKTEAE
jgi:hypothetical protein